MTDFREKLADLLDANWHKGCDGAADAIIDALPDMIPDLVWEDIDKFTSRTGPYTICKAPFETYWRLFCGADYIAHRGAKTDLIEVANTHHRAQIIKAMGVGV